MAAAPCGIISRLWLRGLCWQALICHQCLSHRLVLLTERDHLQVKTKVSTAYQQPPTHSVRVEKAASFAAHIHRIKQHVQVGSGSPGPCCSAPTMHTSSMPCAVRRGLPPSAPRGAGGRVGLEIAYSTNAAHLRARAGQSILRARRRSLWAPNNATDRRRRFRSRLQEGREGLGRNPLHFAA